MLTTFSVIGPLLLVSVTIHIASTRHAEAQAVRCDVVEKYQCEPAFGCHSIESRVWNVVDLDGRAISRCDSFGCDEYEAVVSSPDGSSVTIEVPGIGLFAAIGSDGMTFTEMAKIGDAVVVSFGACRER